MKKLVIILIVLISLLIGNNINAQNLGIGPDTFDPDPSAGVEMRFTNKGLLIPRVALTSTSSASPITSPANSLLVYNTASTGDVTPGYYYWNGSKWMRLLAIDDKPAWLLNGNAAAASNFIGTTNAIDFRIYTNNTERMTVEANGNVGIGTTSPGAKLDVAGEIRATILKDRDNVAYYLDPASASLLAQASARKWYVDANGVPTSNLGSPTIQEMALFQEQFNNKLEFYPSSTMKFETYDGSTWTDVTASISDANKMKLVGGDNSASISIPYGVQQYRITIRNNGSYVYLNALYMYWSGSGHSTQVQIWKKRDDGDWIQHTNSTVLISAWPGHMYLPFNTIPWSLNSTTGHYNDIRIVFIPTWNSSYPSNNIILYKMQLWGGYPAGKRTIYSVDEYKGVTFPANLYVNGNVGIGIPSPTQKLDVVGNIRTTGQLMSTITTGTAPLSVASTTLVTNLNADMLDGHHWSEVPTIPTNNVTGSGTATRVAFWSGANTLNSNANLYWDNTNSRLGVGTSSPAEKLHINGSIRGDQSGALRINTGSGYIDIGPKNTSWAHFYTDRSRYWFSTGLTVETGNIGSYDEDLSLQTSGTTRITILNSNGNVGIGTISPTYKLHVAGNIKTNTINETSDARFKKNIQDINTPLSKVLSLRGVYYYWDLDNPDVQEIDSSKQIGMIAQEVEKILPELVNTDSDGYKSVEYSRVVAVLIEAMKEQQKTIEQQQKTIDEQKDMINNLNERITKLEELIKVK